MKKQQNNSTNAWALQVALSAALLSIAAVLLAASFNSTPGHSNTAPKGDAITATPIKHVIVIVGENRSFDHLFATYVPKPGQTVNNLLSEGIINADGTPGSNYSQATQFQADITGSTTYQPSPMTGKTAYLTLPAPLNGGPTNVCIDNGMCSLHDALATENGLAAPPILTTRRYCGAELD
jgi:phospholipase C